MKYLKIMLRSDLCAGNGESVGNVVDTDVCMDKAGLPFLPSRRVKGCLKQAAFDLEKMGYPNAKICREKIFGDSEGHTGCLWIQDGHMEGADALGDFLNKLSTGFRPDRCEGIVDELLIKAPLCLRRAAHSSNVERLFSMVRGQTSLENGVKVENSLRFTRVVGKYDPFAEEDATELVFLAPFSMNTDNQELKDFFNSCILATRHIGSSRNRGLGNISISVVEENNTKEEKPPFVWDGDSAEQVLISFKISLDAPVTLPGCDELSMSIPARSLIGCLTSEYLKTGSAMDELFNRLFLNGEVRYSPLTPVINGSISDPAPMVLVKLKNDNGRLINYLSESGDEWKKYKPKTLDGSFSAIIAKPNTSPMYIVSDLSVNTSYHFALNRENPDPFISTSQDSRTLYMQDSLSAGMIYGGTIVCTSELAEKLVPLLNRARLSFGRSKSAQYASCSLYGTPSVVPYKNPTKDTRKGETLYVILKTDLALLKNGMYLTQCEEIRDAITDALGVSADHPENAQDHCRYHTVGGFQTLWQLQKPQIPVVRAGSVYCFNADGEKVPSVIQVGALSQEGFGLCYVLTQEDMQKRSIVETGKVDIKKPKSHEERISQTYDKLLAFTAVEAMKSYAVLLANEAREEERKKNAVKMRLPKLPVGRLRLMLAESKDVKDFLSLIATMKESDVSSEQECSKKARCEVLVRKMYIDDTTEEVTFQKLLSKEKGLWETLKDHKKALLNVNENWKVPMETLLHHLHYMKER